MPPTLLPFAGSVTKGKESFRPFTSKLEDPMSVFHQPQIGKVFLQQGVFGFVRGRGNVLFFLVTLDRFKMELYI